MTTPTDLVLVPRENISISGYRGDKTLLERLQETPLPSLNRICQDRKDAAHFIEAMIASAPSQEGADRDAIIEECARIVEREMPEPLDADYLLMKAGPCEQDVQEAEERIVLRVVTAIRSLKKRDGSEKT